MAITLTSAYLAELKRGSNTPNVVLEFAFDSGTRRFGYHGRNEGPVTRYLGDGTWLGDGSITGVGDDSLTAFGVEAILKSVSSLQNKLDPKGGYATRGEITAVIVGRDRFRDLLRDEYLKNRRVTRKDGFIRRGFTYLDYAATYEGKVIDWSRKGDELTLVIADDMVDTAKKIPVENATKTQYLDYTNNGAGMNPVDIMKDILSTQLGIGAAYVDTAQFDSERDLWLNSWKFSRVITEPKAAKDYLNELQKETNSFIVHDGEKISYKVFAPPMPGTSVDEWSDASNILLDSLSQKSGYKDHFYNRIVFYYDFDESGSDKEENFEAAVISVDAASQGSGEWDEVKTKVIKSKWIRSFTHDQPTNVTGAVIYHVSRNNGVGSGTLTYTYDAGGEHTLQWTPPGGTIGEAVTVSKDGKFQVFGADKTRWVRVVVTNGSLPGSNQSDTITLTALNGLQYATAIANKLLSRYRDPVATVAFEVDINNVAYDDGSGAKFIKPTDLKNLTTDEACDKGENSWVGNPTMITSVRLDKAGRVRVEAIETHMDRKYAVIAPAGQPDWDSATDAEKEYAYIGKAGTNTLRAADDPGFYHW